jgi:Mg2+ and Co2+ transporter CorA
VTARGVIPDAHTTDVRELLARGEFFWADVVGDDAPARAAWVAELDFAASDGVWFERFGQSGRISLEQQRLRVATWLAEGAHLGLIEIHLLGSRRCALTAWNGDVSALDEVRVRFVETLADKVSSPTAAIAVLLQLILSTLHSAVSSVDAQLASMRRLLAEAPAEVDFAVMSVHTRRLQSFWSEVERYSEAVKTAMIGLEAGFRTNPRDAEELASYAEQVEDLESRLKERSELGYEILRDYATEIAYLQSRQINRLTMVSIIFLPITFLTGFFGMNFGWMVKSLDGPAAFAALGLALPALYLAATAVWLSRRPLIGDARRPRRHSSLQRQSGSSVHGT